MKDALKTSDASQASDGALSAWNESYWGVIKYGMTPSEVQAFADRPGRVEKRATSVYWYYFSFGAGTVYVRFDGGKVTDFGRLPK